MRVFALEARQAREINIFLGYARKLGAANAASLGTILDVSPHGTPREERVILEDDGAACVGSRNARAGELHDSRCRKLESGDQVEERRLSAAAGADDTDEFVRCLRKRNVTEREHGFGTVAVNLRNVADVDENVRRTS